jgi:hypothetical protein
VSKKTTPIKPFVPRAVQEVTVMKTGQWDPLAVAAAINNLPSELDRAETYSNAPTRPIHSAALGGDDDAV